VRAWTLGFDPRSNLFRKPGIVTVAGTRGPNRNMHNFPCFDVKADDNSDWTSGIIEQSTNKLKANGANPSIMSWMSRMKVKKMSTAHFRDSSIAQMNTRMGRNPKSGI